MIEKKLSDGYIDIYMIGHACLLVKTPDISVLMDPILLDPHQRGIFSIYPERNLDIEKLPDFDVIIISHRHLDHFDVASLSLLNRNSEVLFPKDSLIDKSLERLGFQHRIQLDDWETISYGNTTITTTPSLCPVPEFGLLIKFKSLSYWNQVDTIVSDEVISIVNNEFGIIDVVHAPWQPMMETSFIWGESISFPYEEYEEILQRMVKIKARLLIPGANGFKYEADSSWLNSFVFPVTLDRLESNLYQYRCFDKVFKSLLPGDSLKIRPGGWDVNHLNIGLVKKIDCDQTTLFFNPNSLPFKSLSSSSTKNFDEISISEVKELLQNKLEKSDNSKFVSLQKWKVVFELNVYGDDSFFSFNVDFSNKPFIINDGQSSMTNLRANIKYSALVNLIKGCDSWANIIPAGEYSISNSVFNISNEKFIVPAKGEVQDLLWLLFSYQESLENYINSELEKLNF